MLRSRSSAQLLPVTTNGSFSRHDSHSKRRRTGGVAAAQRVLPYLGITLLLAGAIYGVVRINGGAAGLAAGGERAAGDFAGLVEDELLEDARRSGITFDDLDLLAGAKVHPDEHLHEWEREHHEQQQQQQQGGGGAGLDRRAAIEQEQHQQQQQQQHELLHPEEHPDEALGGTEEQQQERLEQEHLQGLQHLEHQQHPGQQRSEPQQQQQQQGQHADPGVAAAVAAHIAAQQALPQRNGPSLYSANLSAVDIRGNVMHTADLEGKVTVVVNVASQCGYTESNYKGLHRLYQRYREYGLQVLAFPCNQFGSQEPGSHAEIEEFVLTHYGAQFPLMSKVEVNGPGQHPIWAWLKLNAPAVTGHRQGEDIGWNFEKLLIDKHGHPVKRYSSDMVYHDLEMDVYNELIKN